VKSQTRKNSSKNDPIGAKASKSKGTTRTSRPKLTEAISETSEHAEAIIRTVPDPLVLLNADLRVQSANEAFYRAFKLSPGEAKQRSILELGHGSWNAPRLRQLLEDIIPRNSFFNDFELTHDFERIGRRSLLLNARALNEHGDKPKQILLGIRDITEVLAYQAEVRQSEARKDAILKSALDAIIVMDHAGKLVEFNPAAERIFGYSRAEAVGKPLADLIIPLRLREQHKQGLARYLATGKGPVLNRQIEMPAMRADGTEFPAELAIVPVPESQPPTFTAFVRDITERKQAEVALSTNAAWQRMLFENVKDFAIFSMDEQGRITDWNPGAERFFGYTSDEVVGRNVSIVFTPEDRAADVAGKELRTAQSEGFALDERWHLRKNGERFFASGAMRPLRDDSGKLLGFVKIARDITERKRTEEALRQSQAQLADRAGQLEQAVAERTAELSATNKQLEAFIYSVAHDLRAPVRSMEGFSTLLLAEAGASLSETGQDFAKRINRAAQFMDALLMDLLAFGGTAQQPIELIPVNLERVVQSVLSRLENEIQETNARVENPGPWPTVLAHESMLGQVLINLVGNALKFVASDTAPRVRVRVQEWAAVASPAGEAEDGSLSGNWVRVWVEDNGIGVAPEHQQQIFRLFNRLHGTKYPGTGIGLAIVQKGIERMGGRVGVESNPNHGSRFWFELRKA
jgi:PAS domain S-box-containing protein